MLQKKHKWIGIILLGCLLAVPTIGFIFYYCIPFNQEQLKNYEVKILQRSYYQIDVNGKPYLYFSDYQHNTFLYGTTNKEAIHYWETELKGYWTNQIPILPSSFGNIVASWRHRPSPIVALRGEKLRKLLFLLYIQTDNDIAALQTQNNELTYYLRIHNVQDYGYNRIAEYHDIILHKMDSIKAIQEALSDIPKNAHLSLKQMNSYQIASKDNKEPIYLYRKEIVNKEDAIRLRTTSGSTPAKLFTRVSISGAYTLLHAWGEYRRPLHTAIPLGAIPIADGYYIGEQKKGFPHGYGKYYGNDGTFYDGHWENGKRNGFGFSIAPYKYLFAGYWENDICKGERLTYTDERIYGIDLSRHQHEHNQQIYPIHWDRLRITHLGTLSDKTIKGKVDYPISFIYIKSTEGTTVFNPYYNNDYKAARLHGFRVGTYHFFSTTSSGIAQANYFLQKSAYLKGDMPLVLDVEPSDTQIAKMGGAEAMFKQIRGFLNRVYEKTHRRPILYISQMFANIYMPLAEDLGDNYLVWIARYGQYKPNIKLVYWQLSPDGKVNGVHGDVDINVFNGYRNQYEEFLKRHALSS